MVKWRGGIGTWVFVEFYGPVQVLGGRGVSAVGWDCAEVSGGVVALGNIRRVLLIMREDAMAGL